MKKNIEDLYRLSPLQQGILFHTLYEPNQGEYIVQFGSDLEGDLDLPAFERAWRLVVDRHPVLRTSFHWEKLEKPVQAVHRRVPLPLETVEWPPLGEEARQEKLQRFLEEDRHRGFDLGKPPLIRLTLIRCGEASYRFVWTYHHLLLDGWSLPLLLRELFSFYEAFLEGREPSLPVGRRFREYISWLQKQDLSAAESFWRQQLAGLSEPTPLGVDRPLPQGEGHGGGARVDLRLPADATRLLTEYSSRHRLTPNSLMQGAWALLLSRYSGRQQVVFGTTVSGRPASLEKAESMVGLFINTLPVRLDLPAEASLAPWLQAVQQRLLEVRQYEYSPLPEIQRWSGLPSGVPLFESIVVYENFPTSALGRKVGELAIQDVWLTENLNYPLAVIVERPEEETAIRAVFDSKRFDAVTAQRTLSHLANLVDSIATRPRARLADLSLLSTAEQHQLLAEWNDSRIPYDSSAAIHQLIEGQAERTPGAPAVVFQDTTLTYGELNARANQLAHHLQRLGVGPEMKVAVCLERSEWLVISLLAVVKAGGAYVPLDPDYPEDRLAFMLEDSGAWALLTESVFHSRLPSLKDRLVVDLDALPVGVETGPDHNPAAPASLSQAAYMIYTSGSTGRPKGVINSHRGILNRLQWMQQAFGLTAQDAVFQKTTFSFDVSVWEFFWPLMYGARLVVAAPGGHKDPGYLAELIDRQSVTTMHFVPSMLQAFLEYGFEEGGVSEGGDAASCSSLQRVICSGEALSSDLESRFLERLPGSQLHNLYGPTEAAIDVTWWACGVEKDASAVPIGRPIANTSIHVMSPSLEPAPLGVPGELLIGGINLARGYHGRPGLTAEKFVPDPFPGLLGREGSRLYRTGDLVRRRPDGAVEFLGRIDHQVKVRGFRIELGEIEAALEAHPSVGQAVVLARSLRAGSGGGEDRLVAYVVPWEGARLEIPQLREHLEELLPDYMVPALFMALDSIPLTPNGKVDRKALPEPTFEGAGGVSGYLPPRNDREEALAAIFSQVLGVERVGVEENFFELGGDSILSLQIVSRASQAGLGLTPRQIFDRPTVASLAAVAEEVGESQLPQGPAEGEAALLPIQRWFFEGEPVDPHHWNQAVLFEARQPLDGTLLEQALAAVIDHHDSLRLRFTQSFTPEKASWKQEYSDTGSAVPLTSVDLSSIADPLERRDALEAACGEIQGSLDLGDGPVLRVCRFDLGEDSAQRLLMVIHHLVVDGVSWRVILEDFHTAYGQLAAEQEISLPPKTTSYQAWGAALETYASESSSQALASTLPLWQEAGRDLPALPVDYPAGTNREATARNKVVTLDEGETEALLRQVPGASRAQVEELLLAALVQAVGRWTGRAALRVDLEGHGREALVPGVDLSRSVGWFTSLYPLVVDAPGGGEARATVAAVKQALRQLPHRGISYGLQRYLRGEESLANQPSAEMSFNYLGQFDQVLADSPLLRPALESGGPTHSGRGQRRYLLEVTATVVQGRLQVAWTYSVDQHRLETLEQLTGDFLDSLRGLIHLWTQPEAVASYAPAEFPLAGLDETSLTRLVSHENRLEAVYPLTPLQEGILFHGLFSPDSDLYVEQLSCRIGGELDTAAFQQAWQEVVQRYRVLRTGFVWEGYDQPLQVVSPARPVEIAELDWRELAPGEQEEALLSLQREMRSQPFDLSRAPLIRLHLVHLAPQLGVDQTHFVWTYHHLLLDGWSLMIVLGEVFELYHLRSSGAEVHWAPPRPYRDYLVWLAEQDLALAEAHWRKALDGIEAPTSISVGGYGAANFDGVERGLEELRLAAPATAALTNLARSHRVTLNTLVQGAWAILLSRYSQQQDVVFGNTVSGRPTGFDRGDSMVGLFINTLPVRVSFRTAEKLVPWLQELQGQQLEARQFEHSPLAQVQGWSEIPQGEALFDSLLVFENYPIDETLGRQRTGLQISRVEVAERTNYPLTLVTQPGARLYLRLGYDRRRFADPTMVRLLGHLSTLLEELAADPHRAPGELSHLRAVERHQMLVEWNDEGVLYDTDLPLHELVEQRSRRHPDAVAVAFEGETLSYGELDARGNQLAHRLRRLGVGPEARVAIVMERRVELVVSILGVLKAGGAYLPLDPADPKDRLALVLEAAAPAALLTQDSLLPRLPLLGCPVLSWEQEGAGLGEESREGFASGVTPDNLAYVIHTSGSTGLPKGVMIPHRGVVNRLVYGLASGQVREGDRFLQKASISFDVSLLELFLPLLSGGCIVMVRPGGQQDPGYLARLIEEQQVTQAVFPPSLLRLLLEEEVDRCQSLHSVASSADALSVDLKQSFFDKLPAQLFNRYGPTEASIAVTSWTCRPESDQRRVPIGRPIAKASLYVVGRGLEPVAAAVPGELLIGGVGLGRGYLNQPAKTAEVFIPNPFGGAGGEPGSRLYCTGDLVRYRPDGALDFLGRVDYQVKVRGFR
ncbi:MAG: amino acid adenylation domain-containing protein, partial [Deltaproteobacteria bacterium]|nr:amino acid adenylation domain-containing protein [Deltaproteobacteria bacterium]